MITYDVMALQLKKKKSVLTKLMPVSVEVTDRFNSTWSSNTKI